MLVMLQGKMGRMFTLNTSAIRSVFVDNAKNGMTGKPTPNAFPITLYDETEVQVVSEEHDTLEEFVDYLNGFITRGGFAVLN